MHDSDVIYVTREACAAYRCQVSVVKLIFQGKMYLYQEKQQNID